MILLIVEALVKLTSKGNMQHTISVLGQCAGIFRSERLLLTAFMWDMFVTKFVGVAYYHMQQIGRKSKLHSSGFKYVN